MNRPSRQRPDALAAARSLGGPDGVELLATASAQIGARLEQARLRSVHHRAGRSVSHVFDATLNIDGERRDVLLVAHVDTRSLPDGAFVLEADGDRVAVWRFPNDPYLPGLPSAVHRARVRELLDSLGAPPGAVGLRTRAYRPTRRAVVEVTIQGDGGGQILYLKVLAGRRAHQLGDIHRQLVNHVPVPRVVGVAGEQGIVALEALGGQTLRAALVADEPLPDAAEIVELSRRFMTSGLTSTRDPRAFAHPGRHVELLSRLVPDAADRITRVVAEAEAVDGPLVPVHGDLHDGQLLLVDGSVTGVLDVDGSGTGYRAQDAGNLVAHLQGVAEVWPDAAERAEAYAAAVADAFRPEVGARSLARATAGAWLGLATGPYRAQEADWPDATRRRIDRAVAAL